MLRTCIELQVNHIDIRFECTCNAVEVVVIQLRRTVLRLTLLEDQRIDMNLACIGSIGIHAIKNSHEIELHLTCNLHVVEFI